MKRYWIKLWVDINNDPKMGRLSDHLWKRAVESFVMAGENGDDGVLPNIKDMAYYLRANEEEVEKDCDALVMADILIHDDRGYVVKNFTKRQEARTASERKQMYLERKRNEKGTDLERSVPQKGTKKERSDDSYLSSVSVSVSDSVSSSDSIFESHFRSFNGDRETKRWHALVEAIGPKRAEEIASWAEKKEIHMTNRGGLLDSLETAAKKWTEHGNGSGKKTGICGPQVADKVADFMRR